MAKIVPQQICITDLPLGTYLKLKGTKGSAFRRLYKIKHVKTIGYEYYQLWGIVMNLTKANTLEEDCMMTSNNLDRVTHKIVCGNGKVEMIPVRILTPAQMEEVEVV